jgi:hypothetical protein
MEQAMALGFDDNSAHTPVVWCVTGYPEANPAQCRKSRVIGNFRVGGHTGGIDKAEILETSKRTTL